MVFAAAGSVQHAAGRRAAAPLQQRLPAGAAVMLAPLLAIILTTQLVAAGMPFVASSTDRELEAREVLPPSSGGPPAQYWCPVAKLAWEYAGHVQPWRAPHVEVFDALGLSTICGEARPAAVTSPTRASRRHSAAIADGAVVVDGAKGSDQTGTGTEASPFKTIAKGVAAACDPSHAGAMTVVIRQGEYHLGGSVLSLGPYASGLTLAAAPEEHVVLTGGSAFNPQWQAVEGSGGAHVADIPAGLIKPGVKISELVLLTASMAGGSVARRMMTARHPNASPYQYHSWQGGLETASQWGQMSYDTPGNRTQTVISKHGQFERLSARGPYFVGTHGGDVNAFEPVPGETDGRGCGWANHMPYHVSQGVIQKCGPPSPSPAPPTPSPPPMSDVAYLARCNATAKTQLMLISSSGAAAGQLKVLDGSNRCLVAANAGCTPSGPISFLPCDSAAAKACGGAASKWDNTDDDPLNIFRLRSALGGNRCIDSRGDGSISMYRCHHDPRDSHPRRNQEFVLNPTTHLFEAGDRQMKKTPGGWCLAAPPPRISGDRQGDPIACGNWSKPSDASLWCDIMWGNKGYAVRSKVGANVTFDHGGFQMAYGPATNCGSHYLEGIQEALDSPEEFYHDVTANKLYIFPNASLPSTVVAVTEESIISITGTQAAPVHDITIQGITFAGAAKTFLAPHQASTNGADWTAPRRGALTIEGAHSVVVQQCQFDTLGGNGVLWSDWVRNSSVLNSTFQWLGENGVLAFGTDQFGDATDGEYPMNNTVHGCLFREVGVYAKHSGAYAEFVAGEVTLANNIMFNGPRAGIAMNDNMGGGSDIFGNLIFNMASPCSGPYRFALFKRWMNPVPPAKHRITLSSCTAAIASQVRESRDHGPINSWDRNSYVTLDPATGKPRVNYSETSIHHNMIIAGGMHGNGGEFPIDHDDGSWAADCLGAKHSESPLPPLIDFESERSEDVFAEHSVCAGLILWARKMILTANSGSPGWQRFLL